MPTRESDPTRPVSIADWIGWGKRSLENHLDHPEEESRYLMEAVIRSRTAVWTKSSSPLDPDKAHVFQNWILRRAQREPFHLIVGEVDFCGRPLTVRPGVLIPRPETELVVQCCVQELSKLDRIREFPLRVLDLGAGSGAIVLSILLELPNSSGVAVELKPEALSVLRDNVRRYSLEKRVSIVRGDWGDMLSAEPLFDCIVSNPPYIPTELIESLEPEIRSYEPHSALDGGKDGLDAYRRILAFAPSLLKRNGILVFEIGSDQANAGLFRDVGTQGINIGTLGNPGVIKDVSGQDRVIMWKNKGLAIGRI